MVPLLQGLGGMMVGRFDLPRISLIADCAWETGLPECGSEAKRPVSEKPARLIRTWLSQDNRLVGW